MMKLLQVFFSAMIFSLCPCFGFAQQVRPMSSIQIYDALQQWQKLGTVMYIAAHPDDENTRLISFLVHDDHVRTIYLSLTRGDGGQNILGDEQGAALGLIRTYEMMEARRIDGAEQLFTRFVDFGFSKSAEETFEFWDRNAVVADIKKAIQQYKPDVLICRFPTTGEGGHGQHTASAMAALQAFEELAADKNPRTWKPTRILFNAFKFGSSNTLKDDQFKVTIGQYNPLLGESYGEMAGRSRSEHKSQGAGTPQGVGEVAEHFELMAGRPMQHSIYDAVDTSWARIGRSDIGNEVAKVIAEYDFVHPQNSLPDLLKLRTKVLSLKDTFWRNQKVKQLDRIITSAAGLQLEALASKAVMHGGDKDSIKVHIISRAPNVALQTIHGPMSYKFDGNKRLALDQLERFTIPLSIPQDWPITEPYWLQEAPKHHQYQYAGYDNQAVSKNPLQIVVKLAIEEQPFEMLVPISYKTLNPTKGDMIEAVKVAPSIDLQPMESLVLIDPNGSATLNVGLSSEVQGTFDFIIRQNRTVLFQKQVRLEKGKPLMVEAQVPFTSLDLSSGAASLYFEVRDAYGNVVAKRQRKTISYDHIPSLQYFENAGVTVKVKNWKTTVKKIGYLEGAGDKVAETLAQMGFEVINLSPIDLQNAPLLSSLEAIVAGVRLLNTRADLQAFMPILHDYVSKGGTLIYQYNTNANLVLSDFLPYRISLSRSRVTDEKADMMFLDAKDRLLNYPNKITKRDFADWVQERGLYYPDRWDARFKPLLGSNDAQEPQLDGGLLYAPYGKGFVVYTSLAFFRQLPAGHIGAMRLFVNLLNAGH